MKKRIYNTPEMEIVLLEGEDIMSVSRADDNSTGKLPWQKSSTQSLDYNTPED